MERQTHRAPDGNTRYGSHVASQEYPIDKRAFSPGDWVEKGVFSYLLTISSIATQSAGKARIDNWPRLFEQGR
jgi:hypothetical protein